MNNLTGEVKLSGKSIGDVTIATTNAAGSMRSLTAILADCRSAFGQLSDSEKASNAEALIGKNAMSGFLALMNSAPGDISKLEGAIKNCDGTSEKMAETMQDNLSDQLTILKSQLQELAISFADLMMPAIRSLVSALQGFLFKINWCQETFDRMFFIVTQTGNVVIIPMIIFVILLRTIFKFFLIASRIKFTYSLFFLNGSSICAINHLFRMFGQELISTSFTT